MISISPSQRRRRGSVYILIIGVTMLAAAITVAATLAGRVQWRALDGAKNMAEARSYALAAVDLGRSYIYQNSNWRTARSNGSWFTGTLIGNGSMSLSVTNPSGALNHFDADPVILTGTGYRGSAVQTVQCGLTPTIKPYNCLVPAMTAGGSISFSSSKILTAGVLVSSNSNMSLNSAHISANIEAAGAITLGSAQCTGTVTSGVPSRTMPGTSVYDYYTTNGTTISLGSLPSVSGTKALTCGVLAPAVNTAGGSTNSAGIYVIDCQGQQFTISNMRMRATVVLLNCGGLTVTNAVDLAPAISTFPCLLVQGNVTFNPGNGNLVEAALLTNFNPPGAPSPWPTGTSDILLLGSYPCSIAGLIYASGDISFQANTSLGMLVCGGTVDFGSKNINFSYNPDYANNPPPGFYDVDMTTSSASYSQVTN